MSKINRKQNALDYHSQGRPGKIEAVPAKPAESALDLEDVQIIDPLPEPEMTTRYATSLYQKRQQKGVTLPEAEKLMGDRNYFGSWMVESGEADAIISGLTKNYADFAINNSLLKDNFPFSRLADSPANTLVFPKLESGKIACKILQEPGEAEPLALSYWDLRNQYILYSRAVQYVR